MYNSPFHFGTFLGLLRSNSGPERAVLDIQFVTGSVETVLARVLPLPHLAAVRELYVNIGPFEYSDIGLSRALEPLPALEIFAFSNIYLLGLLSALAKDPVLCPVPRTIDFFDCGINSDIIKALGEAMTRRRDSTTSAASGGDCQQHQDTTKS